jgi:Fur family zinc uptake transcriptional regulator
MNNIHTIIQQAEQHCKTHRTRLTEKRKQVLSGLIQSNKALSAYELIDFCKEHYGLGISPMSVYRILEFLEGEQLVHKRKLATKNVSCAHISCTHTHGVSQFLICKQCSKVKEVYIKPATMTDLQATAQEAGFMLIGPELEMNCLCDDCRAQAA